jgi:hypothetical protein
MALLADIGSMLKSTLTAGPDNTTRVPIVWQSSMNARNGVAPLRMIINPQQVQFAQTKRIQKQDVIGGTVYFHFSNERGQNNDILTLSLSGTTGNIDPRAIQRQIGRVLGADLTYDRTGAKDHLLAWLRFYQLTLDPIVDLEHGVPNLVTMTYASALFPKQVKFTGFFMNVLQFSESAQEPFQRQWSVQFTVQSTDPPLDEMAKFVSDYVFSQSSLERVKNALDIADSVFSDPGVTGGE